MCRQGAVVASGLVVDPIQVLKLGVSDLGLIASIDRSEHVDVEYTVEQGQIHERAVSTSVPPWDPSGTGPHSVAAKIGFCGPLVATGATFLGCFAGSEVLGIAVVDETFRPRLAWLAFLHVSRPHRRRGAASALWAAAVDGAAAAGADAMYVSATPTGSAVGFYMSRACTLAERVEPSLYAWEPDDIHLVYRIH